MSRDIGAANITHVDSDSIYDVYLVALEFDTPVYINSRLGTITYDGNDYLGVGEMGFIRINEESEQLIPAPFQIGLTGLDPDWITEALNAGNFGDVVTVWRGYRQDDGTLIADPYQEARGFYEYSDLALGDSNVISITVQHELTRLSEILGRRFSDEQQRQDYAADTGLSFIVDAVNQRHEWGGQVVGADSAADLGPIRPGGRR